MIKIFYGFICIRKARRSLWSISIGVIRYNFICSKLTWSTLATKSSVSHLAALCCLDVSPFTNKSMTFILQNTVDLLTPCQTAQWSFGIYSLPGIVWIQRISKRREFETMGLKMVDLHDGYLGMVHRLNLVMVKYNLDPFPWIGLSSHPLGRC